MIIDTIVKVILLMMFTAWLGFTFLAIDFDEEIKESYGDNRGSMWIRIVVLALIYAICILALYGRYHTDPITVFGPRFMG